MAFIPGYEYDIFVSYAHVDDQPFIDAATGLERATGWVSTLVRHLKNELAQKFGRADAVSVWFDAHELRGNHTLTNEIAARLGSTAILVVILSPGYTVSQWCADEARLFSRSPGDLKRRVFVIEKAPLDDDMMAPGGLGGRRAYRFWYRDSAEQPRTFAMPTPRPEEVNYFRQIEDIARDLRDQCRAMSGSITAPPQVGTAANMGAPSVLLADVTDDLEYKRAEVQRYLEQQGLPVLPKFTYPLGRDEFEAALDADLRCCRLFVQLLGPIAGKRPRDVPDGYGWLQLECARRRGLAILQWRSPEIDLAAIEWPRHRELLELATVQATSFECLKRSILTALAPPPSAPEARHDGTGLPLVFLNAEPRSREIAAEIRRTIGDRAVWTEPLFEGSAEMVREDLEQNLIDCDAMVMVYTDNPGWARAQLRNFHKLSPRRERPVRAIPIIDAPPAEKPELGFFLPEMVLINGRAGIGLEAMTELSTLLSL